MKDKTKYRIGLIGAGAWGTALANIISKKAKVILWAKEKSVCDNINKISENKRYLPKIKLSKKIKCTTSILDMAKCEILFLVSPVQYLSTNLLKLKKDIQTSTIFVCCSKGIEMNSLKLPSEIVTSIFPKNKIAVISGPNFAAEIAKGLPAATVVASKNGNVGNTIAQLIKSPTLRPYLSDDIIGSQIAGALKNIYAIASGIVFGKKDGENAVASIISRSFAEIKMKLRQINDLEVLGPVDSPLLKIKKKFSISISTFSSSLESLEISNNAREYLSDVSVEKDLVALILIVRIYCEIC